ncbi:transforming growth factor-beta receptor type 3-like protein isoform X2 [Ranitomeya variabilis]|uniref:transforming growth factor-beta receptor type 3-like protein isoform X2 n=1 Tax=Ranitomeya variabilis TaxID=490064 RepID=UPI004055ED14
MKDGPQKYFSIQRSSTDAFTSHHVLVCRVSKRSSALAKSRSFQSLPFKSSFTDSVSSSHPCHMPVSKWQNGHHLERARSSHSRGYQITDAGGVRPAWKRVGSPSFQVPCTSEGNVWDSVVVQLVVRGPDKQCEHGSMCSVKVGSKLQIEVSLSAAPPSLGLSLALCSLSPSSDPYNYSHTLLVVNGCPAEAGVSLAMVPPLPCTNALLTKAFGFQLAPFYNNSIQFLHCRVQLCNREASCRGRVGSRNIPECHHTEDLCTRLGAAPLFLRPELQRTVTQPLLVTISAPTRPLVLTSTESDVHGVGIAAAVGVTLSSFFVGVILTAGLWCIHGRTGDYNFLQYISILTLPCLTILCLLCSPRHSDLVRTSVGLLAMMNV